MLTPLEVSGSVDPVLLEDPGDLEPLPEPLAPEDPIPELLPDEEPDEPLIPDDELPLDDPVPEDEATSTPKALAVLLSIRPVACRLLDFWNSRSALCVFGPMTPSSGPGSIPLLFKAACTCFTFSFDLLCPALRCPAAPSLLAWPRSVFMSLDDEPR